MKYNEVYYYTKIAANKFLCSINYIFILSIVFSITTNAQQGNFYIKQESSIEFLASQIPLLSDPLIFKVSVNRFYAENLGTIFLQDTTAGDTLPFPVETKPKLLPDRISFMEKFLWGENGFFRKTGIASPLTPEARKNELKVRRTMLSTHLIGGITTEILMVASCVYGQKIIDGVGGRSARSTHQTLVTATIIDYGLTGLLAVLSPPPLIRRQEASTITIHKTLAWVHFAGMLATPILGNMIGGRRHFNLSRAHVHQVTAYATTAVFTAAMVVMAF